MFQVFDATFESLDPTNDPKPTPYNLGAFPCFWAGDAFMTNGLHTIKTATREDTNNIADAFYSRKGIHIKRGPDADGNFWEVTTPPLYAQTLALLDFEAIIGTQGGREIIINYLDHWRASAPNIRTGFYPFGWTSSMPFDWNRNSFMNPDPLLKKRLTAAKVYTQPIAKRVDYISPDNYLLGPAGFDFDISYIEKMAKFYYSYDKPIYPVIWGVWHTTWNPPIQKDGKSWYRRPNREQYGVLLKTLKKFCDGCIIWGPWEDNKDMWEVFKQS